MTIGRAASVALAAMFVVAAVAKARDLDATADELSELGLRSPSLLAKALLIVELAVAVLLVVWPALGGMAAFALLVAFTVVLVRVLRSGRSAACRCFGAMSTKPISQRTIARNGALLALAASAALL